MFIANYYCYHSLKKKIISRKACFTLAGNLLQMLQKSFNHNRRKSLITEYDLKQPTE